jgi:cAMP-dependent protein kinase regulator
MGCKQSKEATAGGSSSSSAAAKSKNPIPIVLEGLKNNRTSVIDQVFMMTHMVKETATTVVETVQKARHMPNIFATPLEHIDSATYKPPHYAKIKEEQDFIRDAISRNFVFSTVPAAELDAMIGAFEPISYSSQDVILQQGDSVGDFAYVLKKGQVKFLVQDQEVGIVGPGHAFGELALLYRAPRAATCVALTDSTDLYRVDSTTFRYILQTQMQTATTNKRDLLRGIPFLQDLDPADLAKLADNMTPRTFEKGDVIVTKGTVGDAFYVLQEGTIQVQDIEVGGKTYENMTLGPGEYFGERAIVTREPRTANCVATTSGIALCVDSDTFSKVMGNMSQLILKASDKRQLVRIVMLQNILQPCILFLITLTFLPPSYCPYFRSEYRKP